MNDSDNLIIIIYQQEKNNGASTIRMLNTWI